MGGGTVDRLNVPQIARHEMDDEFLPDALIGERGAVGVGSGRCVFGATDDLPQSLGELVSGIVQRRQQFAAEGVKDGIVAVSDRGDRRREYRQQIGAVAAIHGPTRKV